MNNQEKNVLNHTTKDTAHRAEIQWVQDKIGVILVDELHQRTARLEGDDALLWGWLNAGLSADRCARLLGKLEVISQELAQQKIETYIKVWQEAGWLKDSRGTDE